MVVLLGVLYFVGLIKTLNLILGAQLSRGVESLVSQTVALDSSKSRKTVSVQHSQSLRYQRTLFFQLINSCFSHYYVPTDGVAPFSVDMNHTRLIIFRSDI